MFVPDHWAAACFNSLEREGGDIEESICVLCVLASWVKSLRGEVFGSSAAEKAEELIRNGIAKINFSSTACEIAIRFFVLMIRKNTIKHIDAVIDEIRKLQNRKNGVVSVLVESVLAPDDKLESRIIEAVKKQSGAFKVELKSQVNPELIGGYRLRIGDELIDASIRTQLLKLETLLAGMEEINGK